ncbi:hypothetical protein DPMN_012120 [Dreissena polymorpha]|uniref:Uncharacterized protein n=1 Tax=Dreissena polymorpha TaxID=45954 RepID=A0A9D4N2V4_DREPO|nr:hypothetical protein DPMN_012120 [Dreissena polymorpha]
MFLLKSCTYIRLVSVSVKETRSAAAACASRPRRESPAEDLLRGNFCGWLC